MDDLMEIVKPENYQDNQRSSKYYLYNEDERAEMPVYQKIALGAIAGAGLLAFGHRTGAVHKIARFLDRDIHISAKAWRSTINQESGLSKNLNWKRFDQTRQHFLNERKRLLAAYDKEKNPLNRREFDIQNYLNQRERLIGSEVNDEFTGEMAHVMNEDYRLRAIMQEIRQNEKISSAMADRIQVALGKGGVDDLRLRDDEHIRFLLNNQKINDHKIVDWVNASRHKYQNIDFLKNEELNPGGANFVRQMQEKMRDFTAHQLQYYNKKNGWIKSRIIGHKQATVGDILELHRRGVVNIDTHLRAQIHDALKYNKKFRDTVFDRNLYIKTRGGKPAGLMDYNAYHRIGQKTMEWWSHTLPGGLLHLRDFINSHEAREQAAFRIMKRESIQPMLNAQMGLANKNPLHQPVVFAMGRFVRLFDDGAVNHHTALNILNKKREMYLTSSRFGTLPKIVRSAAGLETKDKRRNLFTETFDLFNQGRDADSVEMLRMFTKYTDPTWERNVVRRVLSYGIKNNKEFYDIRKYFNRYTSGYTPRTLNRMKKIMPQYIQDYVEQNQLNFGDSEDLKKLFGYMGKHVSQKENPDFYRFHQEYLRNPNNILSYHRSLGNDNPIIGGNLKIQTGEDIIRQQVSREITRQIINRNAIKLGDKRASQVLFRKKLESMRLNDELLKGDLDKSIRAYNQYLFEEAGAEHFRHPQSSYKKINELFTGSENISRQFQKDMHQMYRQTNPIWEEYSPIKKPNPIGDDYLAVNRSFKTSDLLGRTKEFFTDIGDKAKQLALTTGRRNLEDVTTMSIFGGFYPAYRLQEALGAVGLGFSDESLGSPLSIWSSLMLKRILPIFGAVGLYGYADYKMQQDSGAGITERYENYKADRRTEAAQARYKLGQQDKLKHELQLKPGIDQFNEMPNVTLPIIGTRGPGDIFNTIASLVSRTPVTDYHNEDRMNVQETKEDLTSGVTPVRKGRWWAAGSRSAYVGDRIQQFKPNSYRLAHSDWEHSNVTATGEEKYSHSFFPTAENPLGFISYLIGTRDPYWYEKKHYFDRPYLLTGDLFNSNTPFIGDIGNMTIGQVFKPSRKMHEDYWGDPVLVQEATDEATDRDTERGEGSLVTRVSPSGRREEDVFSTPSEYGAPMQDFPPAAKDKKAAKDITDRAYYVAQMKNISTGKATGDEIVRGVDSGQVVFIPSRQSGNYASYSQAFKAAATAEAQNRKMRENPRSREINKDKIISMYYPGQEPTMKLKPRGIHDFEYLYQKRADHDKLRHLNDPNNLNWRLQNLQSNWSEPAGIYNWIINDELLKNDPYRDQKVIAKAHDAYDFNSRFWDQQYGSLGGELSEIGRRFIRKDSGFMEKYNPIQNRMPSWLPGSDYFQNFREGDPYTLIPNGEYRLPGEAYEKLNKLHPDETGRYGAFDKFKILADVAPWSNEYNFWKEYVNAFTTDKTLRKQFADIKRQVSKRKKKYDFQPYHFRNTELEKQQVTVTKFLDDYTFLTKEFGNQPLRMAGMDVRAKAPGILQQYFKTGDKITIGFSKDPVYQKANDTYGTMHVDVFAGLNSINQQIIARGQAKESPNDFTPTGVWARFTPEEIARGHRWENVAHFESALNTKFLHVRSAVEEYERDQIYGKDWSTWENFGISDYLIPAVERMIGNSNPLMATMSGGLVGGFIGRLFLGGGKRTKAGLILGALTGFGANMWGKYYEYRTGKRWIPKRRRTENDINEYFDFLKYLKYHGLYEETSRRAKKQGYHIDKILQKIDQKKQSTKKEQQKLIDEKRRLYIQQPKDFAEKRKTINAKLNKISENWNMEQLPDIVSQTIYYKDQMEATLYGMNPKGDYLNLMRALPYKDKWFFQDFAKADSEDRKKILSLIPENERPLYLSIWGMKPDEKKPVAYYLKKYNIPSANWAGWRPDVNLEDVKVKAVKNAGLDLSDFNYWDDDLAASRYAPDINSQNNVYNRPAAFKGYHNVEQNIREIMEGYNLRNVHVIAKPSQGGLTQVNIQYMQDRKKEIEKEFNLNSQNYV
jgi:hypothetical protein